MPGGAVAAINRRQALSAIVTGPVGLWACAARQTPSSPNLRLNAPLDFELPDTEGRSVRLSDLQGQVILVDLWATWCKPCEKSFPFYVELYTKHRSAGFEILAISVDAEDAEVATYLARRPVPFRVLRDPRGTVPSRLDIRTMPTAVLVGRDGKIRWVHAGFVDNDRSMIAAEVASALNPVS